jgi:hypothetical protein
MPVSSGFGGGLALAFYGIIAGLCVWQAVSMLLDRALTLLEFVAYVGLMLATFSGAVASYGTPFFPVLLVVSFMVPVSLPLMNWLIDRLTLQRLRVEDIAHYRACIEEHPEASHFVKKLADALYDNEEWAMAKEYYEQYRKQAGDRGLRFRVKHCDEMLARKQGLSCVCPKCKTANPKLARHCLACEAPLPGPWEFIEAFRGRAGMSILLWSIGITTLIALAFSFLKLLPPILVGLFWLYVIGAAFFYLFIKATSASYYNK